MLAVVAVAPRLAWGFIPLLVIIVCPLMMFLMMRDMGTMGPDRNAASPTETRQPLMPGGTRAERLTELKARNERLAREIAQLDADGASPREPTLAAPPARAIPRNETDVTA